MPTDLAALVAYLNSYLRVAEVPDSPNALNGLQVENSGTVAQVAAAVDACQTTIDRAVDVGADLMLVHHGLFWGGPEPITGRHARRIRRLIEGDTALYSAHLPLDMHPEVGNNAVLANALGLRDTAPFGDHQGTLIGVIGTIDVRLDELVGALRAELGSEPHVIAAGPERVQRVGVITGGAGDMIRQAWDAGADTFVSGEGSHHTHFDAEEWGLNVVYAGHYATETVGVKALAQHIENRFGLPWEFIDHPTGL